MEKENESAGGVAAAVFCRGDDRAQFAAAAARLGRACAAVEEGGLAEAEKWLAENAAPGLIVVDVSNEPFPVPALADLAAMAGPGCRIAAVGRTDDVGLYRSLLSAGIFEYLVSPVTDGQIAELFERADGDRWLGLPEAGSVRVGQTVAVTGVAGGVGVSTTAALLGKWIADQAKFQTLLVDFDRRKGDLALMLGLKADNGLSGILSAAQIDYRLIARTVLAEDADAVGKSAKSASKRLSLLAQRPGPETPVDPQLLLELGGALCELFSVSIWDIPSHRPSGSVEILTNADVCVILTDLTVSHARAAKILLAELGSPKPGQRRYIVANACRAAGNGRKNERPVLTKEAFEEFLGAKIDFELPYAGRALEESLVEGAVSAAKAPAFGAAVEALACGLLGRPAPAASRKGLAAALDRLKTLGRRKA